MRAAEIVGHGVRDVRIVGDTITEIAPALRPSSKGTMLEAHGGALLPGLCDHHVHLYALAESERSIGCGPPPVGDATALRAALANARPGEHGWLRGIGYVETVAGPLDAATLDRLHDKRPVRIQHRSGALWMLNSMAITALGLRDAEHPGIERASDGSPTGRLWRADNFLRTRLPSTGPPDLADLGKHLARLGITAVTDATPNLDAPAVAAIDAAMRRGALPQRTHLLGAPLDQPMPPGPGADPYKIVLADSGLPGLADLTEQINAVHARGRPVAVHCVTREALILLLAALTDTGTLPGDRVEHAALVPAEIIADIAALGLRVVTQPGFLADRGDDMLRDLPAEEHADLYRLRSLRDAGIPCTPSSDAPYGPLDPWQVLHAAAQRRTRSGAVVNADERIPVSQALAGYLSSPAEPGGPARRVLPGAPADLVLLHEPLADALTEPRADLVHTTIIGGACYPN